MTGHVDSVRTYAAVWITLLILTAVTTTVAYVDLGPLNVVVALTIAAAKTLLVALFFMHVRHSNKLTKLVILGAMLWLAILIVFTLSDYISRGWLGGAGR